MSDLTLICGTCRFPIERGKGSIYVRLAEVNAKQQADLDWKEAHPFGTPIDITDFLLMPGDIHWRVGHDACRADHDESCYEIDDHTVDTWQGLCRWTAHLMEKNWFPLSDWDTLLRELGGEVEPTRIRPVVREAA